LLSTTHAAAGAVIGSVCRTDAGAALAGWCSHFALDRVHHWGSSDRNRFLAVARVDGLVMLATSATLVLATQRPHRRRVALAVAAAVAPDMDKPVRHFFDRQLYPSALNRFHAGIQRGRESDDRLGGEVARAAIAIVIAGWAVRRLR
jgi:hypothetical protein